MSRTLLYYPTFELPSDQWLKDSLLYWDQVGSIVPERFARSVVTRDLRYLSEEGIYRRFDPTTALKNYAASLELAEEFKQRLDSRDFATELAKHSSEKY